MISTSSTLNMHLNTRSHNWARDSKLKFKLSTSNTLEMLMLLDIAILPSLWPCLCHCHRMWYYHNHHYHWCWLSWTLLHHRSCVACIHYQEPNAFLRLCNWPTKEDQFFRYPNLLGSLKVSDQAFWHPNGFLLWAHNWCTDNLSMHPINTLDKHVTRIKLNWEYISLFVLVLAILLYMPNLLASIAKSTIASHKGSFEGCNGCLAFLGALAQSLFIERKPLATQAL